MNFSVLAEAFEKMENTTKRLELTDHLVDLFRATPPETISKIVYRPYQRESVALPSHAQN